MADRVDELLAGFAAALDGAAPAPAIDRDDAAAIAGALHAQLDVGTAARAAAITDLGHALACARGCAACCETVLLASEAEVSRVAAWLDGRDGAAARAGFVARYPAWRAAAGDLADAAAAASARGDVAGIRAAMAEATRRHVMCPFNADGACTVYPVRPATCRIAHALDTPDDCRPGRTARGVDFVPITAFVRRIRPLEEAIATALDEPAHPRPLADRVHARLGG